MNKEFGSDKKPLKAVKAIKVNMLSRKGDKI